MKGCFRALLLNIRCCISGQLLPFANPTKPTLEWLVRSETRPAAHEYFSVLRAIGPRRLNGGYRSAAIDERATGKKRQACRNACAGVLFRQILFCYTLRVGVDAYAPAFDTSFNKTSP
jgi:hypothetical protein